MALATATATFDGTQDTVTVTWSLTTNPPSISHGIDVDDGQTVDACITSVTNTGCTVTPTARFHGTVELIAED